MQKDTGKRVTALAGQIGFAIEPKKNCPHVKVDWINQLHSSFDLLGNSIIKSKCKDCQDQSENWVCLPCGGVFCSRYVNGHMAKHNEDTKDAVAFSLSDASFWCYECDSYIISLPLNLLREKYSRVKFPDGDDSAEMDRLAGAFEDQLNVKEKEPEVPKEKAFTREDLIDGLKNKKFKKIVILTGAGISVSAGIPDFRTPGTGLYSQLQKYNLPQPEAIFTIQFFKVNPQPFYLLTKQCFLNEYKPVIAHKFIKRVNDQGMLLKNITQNIDGLQLSAGLPLTQLIQAHGHNRTARCLQCKKEVDIKDFNKAVTENNILRCTVCDKKGLIKPDIVFFGEALPKDFAKACELMEEADLVIVMGTSLVVYPFAYLVEIAGDAVPIVLINNTDSRKDKNRKNSLWLDGNLDERLKALAEDLKWDL